MQLSGHAPSMRSAREIDGFSTTDQHFFGIAAAQRARTSERSMIDHRD
jgi:hypothetical protein